jgi:hypothetical protein
MKCEIPGIAKIDKLFYCTVRVVYDCTLYSCTQLHTTVTLQRTVYSFNTRDVVRKYGSTEVLPEVSYFRTRLARAAHAGARAARGEASDDFIRRTSMVRRATMRRHR